MTATLKSHELAEPPAQQSLRVQRFVRPAGHRKCRVSSGIHDCLTFGYGELDYHGFWEHGCYECARAHEQQFPNDGPCWPHTPKQISEMFPEVRPSIR
jgi:hypothetical protein